MTKTMQPFFLPLLIGVGIMMFLMIYPFGRGGSDTYTQTESSILTTLQQQQPITDISVQETGQSSYPNPFTEEQQQLPENHYHNRFEAILDDEEALEK
jgi:hypothetical protein